MPVRPYGPVSRGNEDTVNESRVRQRADEPALVWTVIYYVLLFAGAWGFYRFSWPLTESGNVLVEFSSAVRRSKARKGLSKFL